MVALANDAEVCLFECAHSIEVIDAGIFGTSDRPVYFTNILAFDEVVDRGEAFADGVRDIFKRLGFRRSLLGSRQPGHETLKPSSDS